MQVETGVFLDMLLTKYEIDTSQTGVSTGMIRSWYLFGRRKKETFP